MTRPFHLSRWSLLTKFSVLSFVVLAGIAVALAYGLYQKITYNTLRQAAYAAGEQVEVIVGPLLRQWNLTQPLSPDQINQLDQTLGGYVNGGHIVRIKIWNPKGELIYSDDHSLIGRRFAPSDELQSALNGRLAMEVSTLNKDENVSEQGTYSELFEIYVPVPAPDEKSVIGAYEIYHDLTSVRWQLNDTLNFVFTSLGGGFLVLYVSLFAIVRGASRELVRQNREIARRAEQLRVVNEVGQQLTQIRQVEPLLAQIVRLVKGSFGYDRVSVGLVEGEWVEPKATLGYGDVIDQNPNLLPHLHVGADGIIGHAAASPTPVMVNDVRRGESFVRFIDADPTLSELAVPLRLDGTTVGVVDVQANWVNAFDESDSVLLQALGSEAAIAIENAQLFEQIRRQAEKLSELYRDLESSYDSTLDALSEALDTRDRETHGHSRRVADLTCAVARELGVMEADELEHIERGALLHDIGKIGISDRILHKPGPLTPEERSEMQKHPELGARIVERVPSLHDSVPIILYHQERFDGSGYPLGLRGEQIPLAARIFAVVDVFDALTSQRPYRRALDEDSALSEIQTRSGIWFDPQVVEAFLKIHRVRRGELSSVPFAFAVC